MQELVRGYLICKRAAATLHSMQALKRAQVGVRTQRAFHSIKKDYRSPSARQICVPDRRKLKDVRAHSNFPNYMAYTESFKAKLRSPSALKHCVRL